MTISINPPLEASGPSREHRDSHPSTPTFNPYPGLRPFTMADTHVYFGREGQSDALIAKLFGSRFLAVVGTSGSGKSSLIRAGLLPSLLAGYLQPAGPDWCIADFSPGSNPVERLAEALTASKFFSSEVRSEDLESSPRRLRQMVGEVDPTAKRSLLILADQFEELFRFSPSDRPQTSYRDEQSLFVKTLLDVSQGVPLPVYVVITMRSDFIGDCAQFRDLPEAVTNGQYLIPRTTREQRRSIVEGPARVAGGSIANRLVQRFLNDVGDDPDQLPVLQHALMRTWSHWQNAGRTDRPVDIEDYEAIGTLSDALSIHADEACASAARAVPSGAEIVQRVFQRLRDRDASGREIRLPTRCDVLALVAGTSNERVSRCIEEFSKPGRSFLRFSKEGEVDVSHECLLRQWKTLAHEWVTDELESQRVYTRLADRSDDEQLLVDPVLQFTLDWWNKRKPNQHWAARYDARFARAERFLQASENARKAKRDAKEKRRKSEENTRRDRIIALSLAILGIVAFVGYTRERAAREEADAQKLEASTARAQAVTEMLASKASAKNADKSSAAVAALLAASSLQRSPSVSTQAILSAALATLPLEIQRIEVGHPTSGLVFDPKGTTVATAGGGKLELWDVTSGRKQREIPIEDGKIVALGWSESGTAISILSETKGVILDLSDPDAPFRFACEDANYLSMDHDARNFVATCHSRGRFFAQAEKEVAKHSYHEAASSNIAGFGWNLSDDGTEVSYISHNEEDGTYVYGLLTLGKERAPHASLTLPSFLSMWEVSPEDLNKVLWTSGGLGVSLYAVGDDASNARRTYETAGPVANIEISSHGSLVGALTVDGMLQLWDKQTGSETFRMPLNWQDENAYLSLSDATGRIAALNSRGNLSLITPSASQSLRVSHPTISSSGGEFVASCPRFGLARVAATPEHVEITTLPLPGPSKETAVDYLTPTSMLAATSIGGITAVRWPFDLEIYEKDEWQTLVEGSTLFSKFSGTRKLALSQDGRRLCAGATPNLGRALNGQSDPQKPASLALVTIADDGQHHAQVEMADLPAGSAIWACSPSGQAVYADRPKPDSTERSVQKRDFKSGSPWVDSHISCARGCSAFAFSLDGHSVAVGEESSGSAPLDGLAVPESQVVIWRDEQVFTKLPHRGTLRALAFSNDGSLLASADADSGHVWDLSQPSRQTELARFNFGTAIRELGFSLDDRTVLVAGADQVDAFYFKTEDLLRNTCRRVGRDLTQKEWSELVPGEPYAAVCEGLKRSGGPALR